jgi:hypothetical protein
MELATTPSLEASRVPSILSGEVPEPVAGLVGEKLTLEAFASLCGTLAGHPFVKVVIERETGRTHFLNHHRYEFHSDYIAERILRVSSAQLDAEIDQFNRGVYLAPDRKFFLGTVSIQKAGERFFCLETVEIDNMGAEMIQSFYDTVKAQLDPTLPLYFKPANLGQEATVLAVDTKALPRVFSHELHASASYIALNPGATQGRLRAFRTHEGYLSARATLEWYDILVMHRVPDDIPRLSGIINAEHTTPLSHTNVLASGWGIPNCIQLGVFEQVDREGLNGHWVAYSVDAQAPQPQLAKIERPESVAARPAWSVQRIELEEPETAATPIVELERLRMTDRYRYGTKAANLGELHFLLEHGSERALGFYRVKRPPRANLLPYLARFLALPEAADAATLSRRSSEFLRETVKVPRGIAIPFSVQQEFLESSPRIQQAIGKLKMALELDLREIDALCLNLQTLIRHARVPEKIRQAVDAQIASHLAGVSKFVVRSSSNAEDLEGFSAAGIYESINHVASAENVLQSIKEVWASLVSPRSVRLRQEVGISLDRSYMGVIVQEEVEAQMGGVMVTTNPTNRQGDFRNVYLNASLHSAIEVVQGTEAPYQYLFNTVEGGGRNLSLGSGSEHEDLSEGNKKMLQRLAFAGRLLQSHFSPDYLFNSPVDIEWLFGSEGLFVLQLRPYSK